MNENEEPPVTETELARVLELDAKATQGKWKLWGMSVMADMDGTSNVATAIPVADTYANINGSPRTFDADLIAEYRTLTPRLARELAAARAAIKLARERLEDFARGKRTDEDPQFCVKRLSERTLEKMNELYEH